MQVIAHSFLSLAFFESGVFDSMKSLYLFFIRPQDIDFHVPPEYLVNISIREKLSLTMSKYKDDLLFFLFYTNVGDAVQLAAAVELYVSPFHFVR